MSFGLLSGSRFDIVIIVVVVFIHEMGHFIGMKLFRYRDVQMFFIPLFGAAVAGSETNPGGAKSAVVTLLGPLPGIVLGIICAVLYFTNDQDIYLQLARTFLFINAFNLLPLSPLDGGRFLEEVVFSRNARIELLFKLIAGLALVQIAFMLQSVVFGIFALFVLLSLPSNYRTSKMAQIFKREIARDKDVPIDRVPRKYLERLVPLIADPFKARHLTPELIAGTARTVWQKVCHRPPKVAATVGLVAVYFLSCTVGVVAPITLEMQVAASDVVFQMVEQGDADGLRSWLEAGGDVNHADINDETALLKAALLGRQEVVNLLLDSGADIEAESVWGDTPLMAAAVGGNQEVVRTLLDQGADPSAEGMGGATALAAAAIRGDTEMVTVLLDYGADPKQTEEDGATALMAAVLDGHTDVVTVLLNRGADINVVTTRGVSALIHAAALGHTDVVRVLLERGADPTITDEDGLTALMHAQEEGHGDIVALLEQQQIGFTIQRNSDIERPRRQRPAVTGEREITPSPPTLVVTDSAAVDELPRLLASPPLQYPDSLRSIGIEGVVVLEFVIDTTGHAEPSSITVIESPHPAFIDIATDAVLVSVYSPGRTGGVPIPVGVRESLYFHNQR